MSEEKIPKDEKRISDSQQEVWKEDFVLLSEFSEQEGPVAVWIVPEDGANLFNMQSFLGSVMAVDFQAKTAALGDNLEDTKMVLSDPMEDASYYLHHITLLDIFARGYVRPMCLCYVTHDTTVIMANYVEMSSFFSRVVEVLKKGNRSTMRRDVQQRLCDAEHTLRFLESEQEVPSGFQAPSVQSILDYAADLKNMYRRLEDTENKQGIPDGNGHGERISGNSEEEEEIVVPNPADYEPQLVWSVHAKELYEKSLRNVEELCGDSAGLAKDMLVCLHQQFSRPSIVNVLDQMDSGIFRPSSMALSIGGTMQLNFLVESPQLDFLCGGIASQTEKAALERSSRHAPRSRKTAASEALAALEEKMASSRLQAGAMNGVIPVKDDPDALQSELPDAKKAMMSPQQPGICQQSMKIQSFASALWKAREGCHPGVGIKEFVSRYSFVRHMVYNLLKGRPLFIIAHPKNQAIVSQIVQALSIFVPSAWKESVVPWCTQPVRMADLANLKLVGISYTIPLSRAVERCVAMFRLEEEVLVAPPYPSTGRFVDELLSIRKHWLDEDSYLAHLHASLLAISMKSFLYYHLCCVAVPSSSSNQDYHNMTMPGLFDAGLPVTHKSLESFETVLSSSGSDSASKHMSGPAKVKNPKSWSSLQMYALLPVPQNVRHNSRMSFFRSADIPVGDREIVEYLAEVVKMQQALEFYTFAQVCPVIVDYTPCQLFRNLPPKN